MLATGKYIIAVPQDKTKSAGGIMLPVDVTERVRRAEVLSVGEDVKLSPYISVRETVILFDRNDSISFKGSNGESLVAVHESKVIGYENE